MQLRSSPSSPPSYFRDGKSDRINSIFLDEHATNGNYLEIPTEFILGKDLSGVYYYFCNASRTTWKEI